MKYCCHQRHYVDYFTCITQSKRKIKVTTSHYFEASCTERIKSLSEINVKEPSVEVLLSQKPGSYHEFLKHCIQDLAFM